MKALGRVVKTTGEKDRMSSEDQKRNMLIRLSAKKTPNTVKKADNTQLVVDQGFQSFCETKSISEGDLRDWMTILTTVKEEIESTEDITAELMSDYLASARGYGLNEMSTVFLAIHAALIDKKFLIPITDMTPKISEGEKESLRAKGYYCMEGMKAMDMTDRVRVKNGKVSYLKVHRDAWYDKPQDLSLNVNDILTFIILSRKIDYMQPLVKLTKMFNSLKIDDLDTTMEAWKMDLGLMGLRNGTINVSITPIKALTEDPFYLPIKQIVAFIDTTRAIVADKGGNRDFDSYIKGQIQLYCEMLKIAVENHDQTIRMRYLKFWMTSLIMR